MPVFISYERHDESKAKSVNATLTLHRIPTYFDLLDPTLGNGENATASILKGLGDCTHLLTIVSITTVRSWWVPFEIGAATHGDKRIATFRTEPVTLPDYLKIWPVLATTSDLDRFIRRYYQDTTTEKSFSVAESLNKTILSAGDFHRTLKADLGQR